MRKTMKLESYIHTKHVEYMNIVIIVTGSIVGVAYLTELFISWYSGVEYESYAFINRFSGPLQRELLGHDDVQRDFASAVLVQEDPPQPGRHVHALSIVVNIGMWFERYVIIVTSLHRDLRPLQLGGVLRDQHRRGCLHRNPGHFLHPVLAVRPVLPGVGLERIEDHLKSSGESHKAHPSPVQQKSLSNMESTRRYFT